MSKLREFIEAQPRLINIMVARAFINDLKGLDEKKNHTVKEFCSMAAQDLCDDLINIALSQTIHFEERAAQSLRLQESAIVKEVQDYIDEKIAEFKEEDEAEIMDDEDQKTELNSLMGWNPR